MPKFHPTIVRTVHTPHARSRRALLYVSHTHPTTDLFFSVSVFSIFEINSIQVRLFFDSIAHWTAAAKQTASILVCGTFYVITKMLTVYNSNLYERIAIKSETHNDYKLSFLSTECSVLRRKIKSNNKTHKHQL